MVGIQIEKSNENSMAPPGKLRIALANQINLRGTVISSVLPISVLSELVSPGDRILEIDEEDVSQINMTEISEIITRKFEFERKLVLLATHINKSPHPLLPPTLFSHLILMTY